MKWINLEDLGQLQRLQNQSSEKTALIFKHSTSCSISRTALDRLERSWNEEEMKNIEAYYLDLKTFRDLSNQVADNFDVEHQSPQVLIIKNGASVYDTSHFDIDYKAIKKAVS